MNFNGEKREIIRRAISKEGMSVKQIVDSTGITKAHVMATVKKLVQAKLAETYQEFDETLGKNVSFYIRREKPTSNTRTIMAINEADYKKQSEWYRAERKSPRTHVGISSVYNG